MERSISHRFKKDNRLSDAAAFARVFDRAKRSADRWFTVLCRHNDLEFARLGLAISKKHCKKAVDRNRIKRVVRESFRDNMPQLAGLDIVVLNRQDTAGAPNHAMFESLEKHWQKCARIGAGRMQ